VVSVMLRRPSGPGRDRSSTWRPVARGAGSPLPCGCSQPRARLYRMVGGVARGVSRWWWVTPVGHYPLPHASNAFAILGLRALYFLLAGMLKKFHYLGKGLALILA